MGEHESDNQSITWSIVSDHGEITIEMQEEEARSLAHKILGELLN